MAEYPIIMKQKNDQGPYDTLYPQTLGSQVQGNIQSSQISGNIPSSQITGTFPASQITGLPTSLPANGGNADTVGGQTVQQIIQSALSQGVKIQTGSYVGTGQYGPNSLNGLSFSFVPKIVVVAGEDFIVGTDTFGSFAWVNGSDMGFSLISSYFSNPIFYIVNLTWNNNQLNWYGDNPLRQLNVSGRTYNYIAIG